MDILVTNNPLAKEHFQSKFKVDFLEADISGIFVRVRNLIHEGHKLLTHPLTGSVKPNETYYKSVLITEKTNKTDFGSVGIIEDCIQTVNKFPAGKIPDNLPEEIIYDMQLVDLSLICSALDK